MHFQCQNSLFFANKLENALSVPKSGQFQEKFTKKLDTLFAKWGFFLMAGVYVCKIKREKNMQDYTSKKFWSLGMFIN